MKPKSIPTPLDYIYSIISASQNIKIMIKEIIKNNNSVYLR